MFEFEEDELKALLTFIMTWSVDDPQGEFVVFSLLDKMSQYHGFANWIDAYNKL